MSLYCIGDLHGRNDLFFLALDKVNFSYENDKMYLLGDIIDRKTGAIPIIDHIMQHPKNFELILGNHEGYFLYCCKKYYDDIMQDDGFREKMQLVMESYSPLVKDIMVSLRYHAKRGRLDKIPELKKIQKWMQKSTKRKKMLQSIMDVYQYLEHDKIKCEKVNDIMEIGIDRFVTRYFLRELFLCPYEKYLAIKRYLLSCKKEIELEHKNKKFLLRHMNYVEECGPLHDPVDPDWNFVTRRKATLVFPHLPLHRKDTILVYGHDPVGSFVHKPMMGQVGFGFFSEFITDRTKFDFDYRQIFTYVDGQNNHYYNLDLGSNPVGVLCLDTMQEYHIGIPGLKNGTIGWIPAEGSRDRKVGYCKAENCELYFMNNGEVYEVAMDKEECILTFSDYCYEFIIAVSKKENKIFYTRVEFLDTYYCQSIENFYFGQDKEEIIKAVRDHYNKVKLTDRHQIFEERIRRG